MSVRATAHANSLSLWPWSSLLNLLDSFCPSVFPFFRPLRRLGAIAPARYTRQCGQGKPAGGCLKRASVATLSSENCTSRRCACDDVMP